MSIPLLKWLSQISPFRGMPVDDKGGSSQVVAVASETVQLYYWLAGVRTPDAGQLAGVVVEGKLANDNIKNASGSMEATKQDTSLSFTSTTLTTEKPIDITILESVDEVAGASRALALTQGLSAGEYVVDYATGMIYGIKADTGTTLTVDYKIVVELSGSVSTLSQTVDIVKQAGSALPAADDAKTNATKVLMTQNIDEAGGIIGKPPTTLIGGEMTVATSGTAVPLAGTPTPIKTVTVVAKAANTGNIYIGDSTVDKTSNKQIPLVAGDAIAIPISDLATVYIDADVNGEGVDFLASN